MKPLTVSEFRKLVISQEIECQVCKEYKSHSLIRHLQSEHNLSPSQYKDYYPKARLASRLATELIRRIDRKATRVEDLRQFTEQFTDLGGQPELREAIEKLFKQAPEQDKILANFIPEVPEDYHFNEQDSKHLAYAAVKGAHVYMEGPTGCGKTTHAEYTLGLGGRAVRRINMNGDVTAANFMGQMKANDQGTYFDYGILPWCMMHGVPLILDEVDYMPPQIGATLNSVLDAGQLFVPDTNETIKAEPGFMIIATANTGGKGDKFGAFTGTEVLNTAFLNRFKMKLQCDYLGKDHEAAMLCNRFPNADTPDVKRMVQAAFEIREAFKQGNLGITFSTRQLIGYFEMREDLEARESLDLTLLNWLDEDDSQLVLEILKRVQVPGIDS
jgi:MoxR-like ATPase